MALEFHSNDAGQEAADPFTSALLRCLPRMRTIARLGLGCAFRSVASSADIAQSACRQLLEQRSRLEFRGDDAMAALVRTVVLRKIREKTRSAGAARRNYQLQDSMTELAAVPALEATDPVENAINREHSQILARSLELLSPCDAEALVLRHVFGLSQEEIAAHFDLTLSAARNLLHRARGRLAASLRRADLAES